MSGRGYSAWALPPILLPLLLTLPCPKPVRALSVDVFNWRTPDSGNPEWETKKVKIPKTKAEWLKKIVTMSLHKKKYTIEEVLAKAIEDGLAPEGSCMEKRRHEEEDKPIPDNQWKKVETEHLGEYFNDKASDYRLLETREWLEFVLANAFQWFLLPFMDFSEVMTWSGSSWGGGAKGRKVIQLGKTTTADLLKGAGANDTAEFLFAFPGPGITDFNTFGVVGTDESFALPGVYYVIGESEPTMP